MSLKMDAIVQSVGGRALVEHRPFLVKWSNVIHNMSKNKTYVSDVKASEVIVLMLSMHTFVPGQTYRLVFLGCGQARREAEVLHELLKHIHVSGTMFVDHYMVETAFDIDPTVGYPMFVTSIAALIDELERDTESVFVMIGIRAGFFMIQPCEVYELFRFAMMCHRLALRGRLHKNYLNFFDESYSGKSHERLGTTSCYRCSWLELAQEYWDTQSLWRNDKNSEKISSKK